MRPERPGFQLPSSRSVSLFAEGIQKTPMKMAKLYKRRWGNALKNKKKF